MSDTTTTNQTLAVAAMRDAAEVLQEAVDACSSEAGWISRNELGKDDEYLRASLASRVSEAERALAEARRMLVAAVPQRNAAAEMRDYMAHGYD